MSSARSNFFAVMVAFVVLNTITVGLRLWLRISSQSAGYDDYATGVAFVSVADFTTIPPPCSNFSICRASSLSFVLLSFGLLVMATVRQIYSLGTTLCWRPRWVLSVAREDIAKLTFLAVFCCCTVAVPNRSAGRQDQRGFGLISNCYNGAFNTKSTYRLNGGYVYRVGGGHLHVRVPMPSALSSLGSRHWNVSSWLNYRKRCLRRKRC